MIDVMEGGDGVDSRPEEEFQIGIVADDKVCKSNSGYAGQRKQKRGANCTGTYTRSVSIQLFSEVAMFYSYLIRYCLAPDITRVEITVDYTERKQIGFGRVLRRFQARSRCSHPLFIRKSAACDLPLYPPRGYIREFGSS